MLKLMASAAPSQFTDITVPLWAWGALLGVIAVMLAVDLLLHRHNHAPTPRRAVIETIVWISIGLSFALVILAAFGSQAFGEYLSGYVIEKSLSVDNVFVWAVIFASFQTPARYQHRVLFWGIFGALALRAVFIGLGTAILSAAWWTLLFFGALLVYTGIKVLRHRDDEGTHEHDRALSFLKRFVPVTDRYDGSRFFTRDNRRRMATPLLATLVVIEVSDIVFAVDSVPAVLAVSREPFLVFSSNAFAILGLRALYFVLQGLKDRFHYLSHALGAILIFVGTKMLISHWVHVPTALSLAVIVTLLTAAIIASSRKARRAAHVLAGDGSTQGH